MASPVTISDPVRQIADAVAFSRDSRHHSSCRCFLFRDGSGEAFCSDREALWNRAVNRLLDQILADG